MPPGGECGSWGDLILSVFVMVSALMLVVAACGASDSETVTPTSPGATAEETESADTQPADTQAEDISPGATEPADTTDTQPADTQPAEEPDDQSASPAPATGNGTATVTLDNGDVFEFAILCVLDPAEVGDTEFEFYLVSYDDPFNLDVSQFTEDSFGGAANITIFDSTNFGTTWDANTSLGGEVELALDGTTVTGRGVFLKGEDAEGPGIRGDLIANC